MSDAASFRGFVTRAARQPDAHRDRADMWHPLGGETDTVGKDGATNVWFRHVGLPRLSVTAEAITRGSYQKSPAPETAATSTAVSARLCLYLDDQLHEESNG